MQRHTRRWGERHESPGAVADLPLRAVHRDARETLLRMTPEEALEIARRLETAFNARAGHLEVHVHGRKPCREREAGADASCERHVGEYRQDGEVRLAVAIGAVRPGFDRHAHVPRRDRVEGEPEEISREEESGLAVQRDAAQDALADRRAHPGACRIAGSKCSVSPPCESHSAPSWMVQSMRMLRSDRALTASSADSGISMTERLSRRLRAASFWSHHNAALRPP